MFIFPYFLDMVDFMNHDKLATSTIYPKIQSPCTGVREPTVSLE